MKDCLQGAVQQGIAVLPGPVDCFPLAVRYHRVVPGAGQNSSLRLHSTESRVCRVVRFATCWNALCDTHDFDRKVLLGVVGMAALSGTDRCDIVLWSMVLA